jgi:hypothetical protein
MDVSKQIEISRIEELKILSNVRIIYRHDLNPIESTQNLRVQFEISGDVKGLITCYLCLDDIELSMQDRNFLFPLFVESMNILIGKQMSVDEELNELRINISTPKINFNPITINSRNKRSLHKYELELDNNIFSVCAEYGLELIN